MTTRAREPHAFKPGDTARVRRDDGEIIDRGFIVDASAMTVRFRGINQNVWSFHRKGARWVEVHRDQFELIP